MALRASHSSSPTLVVLGCGYVGTAAALQALRENITVIATMRNAEHAAALASRGITTFTLPDLTRNPDQIQTLVHDTTVLVAFPPDGVTDAAIAAKLSSARAVVYISTTGVYGEARGHVDE